MEPNEAGFTVRVKDKWHIFVNANDRPERRRFTVCHEIAHIVLGLPSDHKDSPSWSYERRSEDEIACDVFAAELLLPIKLFKPLAERAEIGLAAVDELATKFKASRLATGSRLAASVAAPCAFVFSEGGRVRYASRSASLREAFAWITPKMALPQGTTSFRVRAGEPCDGPSEVAADIWFESWRRGGLLLEEARHFKQWDQTSTLLWFEDEELPPMRRDDGARNRDFEEQGLAELDGILPWPGRSRRR